MFPTALRRFLCALPLLTLATASTALAGGNGELTFHSSFFSFTNAVRGSVILQPFDGAPATLASVDWSENGFDVSADSSIPSLNIARDANGVGATFGGEKTTVYVGASSRPVTAFAAFFRVVNSSNVPVAGTVNIITSEGQGISIGVPVGGTFFGFTAPRPFTSVSIDATPSSTLEKIDDVRIGVAAMADEVVDQCSDAETITPSAMTLYPFSTVNYASATFIGGSCPVVPSLDNGPDIWLRYVAPAHGMVTISTCGATFDTILRVFDSCGSAGDGTNATQLACNDDFCALANNGASRASQVMLRVAAGEDYLIRVSGYNGATGSGNLSVSLVPDCRADFNHSGGAQSVQDIFDFLAQWFGGC